MITLSNKKLSSLIMMGVNLVFIYFIVHWFKKNIDQSILWENIQLVPWSFIIITLCLNIIVITFYGKRLSILLDTNYATGFFISSVGNAANNFLPFRLGELFRIYFTKKTFGINTLESLLTIFIERISDLAMILFLGTVVVLKTPIAMQHILILLTAVLLGFGGLFFIRKRNMPSLKKLGAIQKYLFQNPFFSQVAERLTQLSSQKKIVAMSAYTVLIWLFTVTTFFIFFKLTLSSYSFSFIDAIALTFFSTLSLAFSTVPTSIGLFEASIVFYLKTIVGVDQNLALGLALLFHLIVIVPQFSFFLYIFMLKRNRTQQALGME